MTIYIENHSFNYEMEKLARLFFPNDKIVVTEETDNLLPPYIYTEIKEESVKKVFVSVKTDGFEESSEKVLEPDSEESEKYTERVMAVELYGILSRLTGKKQPWGILTGVRPIKLFRSLAEKHNVEYAKKYFTEKLLVSPEKAELSAATEKYEKKILSLSTPVSFSLYISVPFCPSRCSYCSFVSQSIEKAKRLVQPYFELLCKEIEYTAEIVKQCGLKPESVYVGGGTPTVLSAPQLSALIETVNKNFDMSVCREFTVEAGRPDTIDIDKLHAIKNGGVDRISINPQTMNDSVLEIIGRKHTSEQTLKAFELARKAGFGHINTDIIAGLPTESAESFNSSLDRICELSPESVTVHTLAMKRSSRLTKQGMTVGEGKESPAAEMLRYAEKKLIDLGYHPYYLYRQTRMEGNLENVGWAKEGYDGIYNVYVMDETHTILGCGAGAVTKLKNPCSNELTRIFNYKYPYEYINGFDEMLNRKKRVIEFYDGLFKHLQKICL